MASLVIENGTHRGEILELQPGTNLLGRAAECHFLLAESTVSGRHCEIRVSDCEIRLHDLGSSNGTFVEGERVQDAELRDGQCLVLGEVQFRVAIPPAHIAIPEMSLPDDGAPLPLADGAPACYEHRQVAAVFRCARCGRTFCDACVHRLRLAGGRLRTLCPACSNLCERLDGKSTAAAPATLGQKLLRTVRVAFTFRQPGKRPPR